MNKRVIRDILTNLFASSLCTAALNIVVYPYYAKIFDSETYGNILTYIGIINLLIAVLGNCLNNTRLILNKRKDIKNESGDYNPTIMIASVSGSVIGIIVISILQKIVFVTILILAIALILGIARSYYIVAFRLKLDYVTQLKTNIIVSIGYILGAVCINTFELWPLPFCLGEGLAFFYTIRKSSLIKEPFAYSANKKKVITTYTDLIFTGLIGNVIAYFDRFLINPILGATSVSIFAVASFWGKAVTPFVSPTANVMLSYLSQKNAQLNTKRYISVFLASIIPLIVFGLIGVWIAPMITAFLYPTLISEAMPYVFIASFGSLIQSATLLIMPVILSVCSSRVVLILQSVYFCLYLGIACLGSVLNGLIGFCYAVCIIETLKTIIYFFVGYYYVKKAESHLKSSPK